MNRAPPRFAVWCLTHLVYGERAHVILGDLLERFEDGESHLWFWRQTLATLAYGWLKAIRVHGTAVAACVALMSVLFFAIQFVDSYIARHVIHFQTHGLLEIDPHWQQRWSWRIALLILGVSQTVIWFAAAGWLIARVHRARPRLMIVVGAMVIVALRLFGTVRLAQGLLTHVRFLEYLAWDLVHLFLTLGVFVASGLWASRRQRTAAARR